MDNQEFMNPNYVPEEFKIPFDVIELPSQGMLYENKKSQVKVEYLTTIDENILSSPNIVNNGKLIDILIERKVKDLGFDPLDLLEGDRTAIIVFLRATGFGEEYNQYVFDPDSNKMVEGVIKLSELNQKKLSIKPDENGEFDYTLPVSGKKVKFRLLTGRDENEISLLDERLKERTGGDESFKPVLRLERQIQSIDGERDKIKLSNIIKALPLKDSRSLNSYIKENEPGLNMKTTATIPGGGSVDTFLRFGSNFFWPEL
jgi:hypothetical protein